MLDICFINCDLKYETEAVVKLFFPLEHFGFLYDEENVGDEYIIIENVPGQTVGIRLKIGECERNEAVSPGENAKETEENVCRALYLILSEFTGKKPEWGALTGIRPVRKINSLLDEGKARDEIFGILNEKYFISEGKFSLCYDTALNQRLALKTLDNNSISLYVGIPFCPSRCSYCSFVSHSITSKGAMKLMDGYVQKLTEELKLIADAVSGTPFYINTVYFGGGTPTALSAEDLSRIISVVRQEFDLRGCEEFTVEAGRPDTIDRDKLCAMKEGGVTRISVNPQSLSDSVLKKIGRIHTVDRFREAFELARKTGFDNINCDTIAGLPGDDEQGFENTLKELIKLSPEGITVHTLTVKTGARLAGSSRDAFADDSAVSRETELARRLLSDSSYLPYYLYRQKNTIGNLENTGYSKKGYECLYNIYIMDETQNILAAGCGGSTKLVAPGGKIKRVLNYKYPYEYISRFDKMTEYKRQGLKNDLLSLCKTYNAERSNL